MRYPPRGGVLAILYMIADELIGQHKATVEGKKWVQAHPIERHPEPHRDPKSGKIIIENSKLYYEDVSQYGAWQAEQWVKQGKYNLPPEDYVWKFSKKE